MKRNWRDFFIQSATIIIVCGTLYSTLKFGEHCGAKKEYARLQSSFYFCDSLMNKYERKLTREYRGRTFYVNDDTSFAFAMDVLMTCKYDTLIIYGQKTFNSPPGVMRFIKAGLTIIGKKELIGGI